jgi:hypothetical protein
MQQMTLIAGPVEALAKPCCDVLGQIRCTVRLDDGGRVGGIVDDETAGVANFLLVLYFRHVWPPPERLGSEVDQVPMST